MTRELLLTIALSVSACAMAAEAREVPHGRVEVLNGYTVVSVEGTPEEMGTAYGTLLGPTIRRVVKALVSDGIAKTPHARENLMAGSKIMDRHQPDDYHTELKAVAKAAGVKYEELALLQYYGDVRRNTRGPGNAMFCTSFAILPPLTREKICLVGRNFDYYDRGVGEYASILAYYRPKGRIPFVTVTWAGLINGWTFLNEKGIVTSFNIVAGAHSESLEAVSTCFLLRHVAERAETVEQGIQLVKSASRACGTNMLIASGDPPNAALIEFDHAKLAIRRPAGGFLGAANRFLRLYQSGPEAERYRGRAKVAYDLAMERRGSLDFRDNIAGSHGVPIVRMNLHSATIDATNRRLKVAMGPIPACKLPFRAFRLTERGLVADAEANQRSPMEKDPVLPKGFFTSRDFFLRGVFPCAIVVAAYIVVKLRRRRAKRVDTNAQTGGRDRA